MRGRLTPDLELRPPIGLWDEALPQRERREGSSGGGGTPDWTGEMGRLGIGSEARVGFLERIKEVIREEVERALRAQEAQLFLRANECVSS